MATTPRQSVTDPDSPKSNRPWQLPRGRHGLPRELVERSQRERLIAAMVRVTAEKGYVATSVADVLEASGVGRATFYELFEGKEQCFLAAHQVLVDDLLAHALRSSRRSQPWPERVREGLAAILDWLASDPGIARVTLLELATVGPAARGRFSDSMDRFTALFRDGIEEGKLPPDTPNIASIAAATAFARIYEEVILGRAAELPQLLPLLTYEVLLPFLGGDRARKEQSRAQRELP